MKSFNLFKFRLYGIIGASLTLLSLNLTSDSFGNGLPGSGPIDAGGGTFSASVVVPPWCGWNQTPTIDNLTLDGSGLYTGTAYDLTGSSGTVYAYVNGGTAIEEAAAENNCSYYGTAPYSAALSMSIDSVGFSGVSDADPDGAVDEEFSWNGSLDFTNNFDAGSCLNYTTNPGASLDAPGSVDVWSVTSDDTNTNNFCSYSITYGSQIPEGLNPTYGDSTYTITGPTFTFTLITS